MIKNIDRYEVIEQIGQGGMAVVYKVKDTRLNRIVALKMIRTDSIPRDQHERFLTRFEREAQALANLDHPNIIPVYDYGEFDGNPYIVMKYQSGGTLKDRLGKPMNYQEAADILIPIADALAYAHENGIIHRDVKPSNILLNGRPMLADFGIAKMLESDEATLTGTGVGVGTPEYMAPEQWKGKPVFQTDIYSLGVVFYELITGQKPYKAETPLEIGIKQATEPLTSPIKLIPDLPKEVEKVLYKAMALNPEDRFVSMTEFREALETLCEIRIEDQIKIKEIGQKTYLPQEDEKTFDTITNFSKKTDKKKVIVPLIFTIMMLGIISLLIINKNKNNFVTNSIEISTNSSTFTITNTATITLSPTVTNTPTITPTPTLGIGATMFREIDEMEMVFVPEGEFEMGTNDGPQNQAPKHTIYLNSFWIDKYEISNRQFTNYLNQNSLDKDLIESWYYSSNNDDRPIKYYDDYWEPEEGFELLPATYISWYGAEAYCEWVGGRLPTEAEWEKAARGTDERLYPWGNDEPNEFLLNFNTTDGGPVNVGSYPDGSSPYGAMDMAGNVWEWVSDWYEQKYYNVSSLENPFGPSDGAIKVLRGGAWFNSDDYVQTVYRNSAIQKYINKSYGFRCVYEQDETKKDSALIETPLPLGLDAIIGMYSVEAKKYLDNLGVNYQIFNVVRENKLEIGKIVGYKEYDEIIHIYKGIDDWSKNYVIQYSYISSTEMIPDRKSIVISDFPVFSYCSAYMYFTNRTYQDDLDYSKLSGYPGSFQIYSSDSRYDSVSGSTTLFESTNDVYTINVKNFYNNVYPKKANEYRLFTFNLGVMCKPIETLEFDNE